MGLCFRDRSYCTMSDFCATEPCDRKVTPEVRAEAVKWWGGEDAPFSLMDLSNMCGSYKEVK
jgi:hypothetical protein